MTRLLGSRCLVAMFIALPLTAVHSDAQVWRRHAVDDELRGADGVRLADANGDGMLDIVTGWEESGATRAYFNPGPDKSKEPWPRVELGNSPAIEDAVWVDLNADRQLDILSSCEGKEQSLRFFIAPGNKRLQESERWRAGLIAASLKKTRWMFATPLVPHEKKDPLVVLGSKNPNGMIALLDVNRISVAESGIRKLVEAGWIMSIFTEDVDRDGDMDILYSDRKGDQSGVYWLENRKHGMSWRRHLVGQLGREVMFMSQPTWEEGRLKLCVAVKPNRYVMLQQAGDLERSWAEQFDIATPATFGTAKGVAVADLDFDGKVELVFSCEQATNEKSGVGIIELAPGSQPQFLSISGSTGIKFDLIELVDLDGDGDLDILTCEERAAGRGLGVIWYENPVR